MTKSTQPLDGKPEPQSSSARKVERRPAEITSEARAHMALRPAVQAALTLMDYSKDFGELSINTLVDDLGRQCDRTSAGDLTHAETILTAQAQALDAIFYAFARKAKHAEQLNQLDAYLRLALKAQSQCRTTLEALVAIKNPQPVAFVRQANIAHGPQQVNNGSSVTASRRRKSQTDQNELMEQPNGERMDTRTSCTPSGADSPLEAMGAVDRTENKGR